MKFKKIDLSFSDLMNINIKLQSKKVSNVYINEDMAKLIQKQVLKTTKSKNTWIDNIETIVRDQSCKLHYNLSDGSCYTVEAKMFYDILQISKSSGALGEKANINYYKLVN